MITRDSIRSAAVLGAGTMGAQIAGHLANAGVPTLLLDLTSGTARDGWTRARALKPDPLFSPDTARLVTLGGFDADMTKLAGVDLIIECIVEDRDIKRALLERVDAVRTGETIVSSNTSGLPLASLADGRSEAFRRRWLGTHFFNPPRYLHLLELIPTADTDPAVTERVARFADLRLGKGVVIAKDRPNFIANHLGLHGVIHTLWLLQSAEYTVEEVDAITGTPLGRPKSATLRTMDIAGLDVLSRVARNSGIDLPPFVHALVERGWTGEKAGRGFYERQGADILVLDPPTLTYRPRTSVTLPALDAVRHVDDPARRTRALFQDPGRVGAFLRATLAPALWHTARVALDLADSIDDVDRAMRWGFGWELGPFEVWDAIGVRDVIAAMPPSSSNDHVPALVENVLSSGRNTFRTTPLQPAAPSLQILRTARERSRIVHGNAAASVVDLEDGVFAVEFHSKMNVIGAEALQMLHEGVAEASRGSGALVVANEAMNFSAGANLMLVLLAAQDGKWDDIDLMIRTFQGATSALRYAPVPVIVATAGLTLGGGCEITLHADRVRASAESYIGLVEAGVGLIPAGGGVKELLARSVEHIAAPYLDLLPAVQPVFETIGFAKVSTSAADARRLGFLRDADSVTMNRERLTADAREMALSRVREGYQPPRRRTAIPVGGESLFATLELGIHLAYRAGRITEHERTVGSALAGIISGGALPHATTVSEEYLLDLEREAFLRLAGEPKTLDRIRHTLKTGKTLRN